VLTIIFAVASFLLELFYVLETLKILRKLRSVFDKDEDSEIDSKNTKFANQLNKIQEDN
jgi:hypothetical protein